MAIRITLECGHASAVRTHTTPEGYTHDWEVFIRGVDNADIQHYIEKVVFHLHKTFPKPKRVVKEPPYVVKETGYAGFVLPIYVYLRNKDEPKRFQILYDLQLQSCGPAINNVRQHSEIISNPSDEFKRKLLKGGAVVVSSSETSAEKIESKTPTMVGKPKLSGSEIKKHKVVESKTSNVFAELFGTPLKTTKVSQDNKKPVQPEKSSLPKPVVNVEKSDKIDKAPKLKDSPHKDSKKAKVEEKKDKKLNDVSKERNRSREKSKRSSSPGSKSHSSPSSKRPPSPVSLKRPPSPSPIPPAKRPASPKSKEKEVKKIVPEKKKEKERDKLKDPTKNTSDSSKSEKRKDKRKHKEERDKERKDKYKEGERSAVKEVPKLPEKKSDKPEKPEKSDKEKSQEYKSTKDGRKSPKPPKEGEKPKDEKLVKVEKPEKTEKSDKPKDGKSDKDRQKYKHKKRDKKDKRDSSKERERKEKRERSKVSVEKQNNVPNAPTNPLSTLLAEITERDNSDSAQSVDDDSFSEPKLIPPIKKETENLTVPTLPAELEKPLSPIMPAIVKKEKLDRSRKDKPKGSKGDERESRKRKRRSESKGDEEHNIKREKDRGHSTTPPLEPVSSSQSPVVVDQEVVHVAKDKDDRNVNESMVEKKSIKTEAEQVAPDSTNSTLVDSDVGEPPVFSEDYVSQLKDLQQKIMTLQDNQELQRVVQVIAETGQYEITKKTFDFDLCALDRRTVQRLQQFFSAS